VSQQVRLLREQFRADGAVVQRYARCRVVAQSTADAQVVVGAESRMSGQVLDVAGLIAVPLVTHAARVPLLADRWRRRRVAAERRAGTADTGRRRRRRRRLAAVPWTGRLDEVGERAAAGEDAPVVRVILVDVAEEADLVGAVLLADLARQVVRTSQTRVQLDTNITSKPSYFTAGTTHL